MFAKRFLFHKVACIPLFVLSVLGSSVFARPAPAIVQDGKPNAQIIIAAENRPRMTTLAALELQHILEKMSGARLPIVTAVDPSIPVKIFVGESEETKKLGIKTSDLADSAYRIVSGPDYLVLIGQDTDRVAGKMPVAASRGDRKRAEAEWDKVVAASGESKYGWKHPGASDFKNLWGKDDFDVLIAQKYGEEAPTLWCSGGNTLKGFWKGDSSGSVNAVHGFLRGLGARFFKPGEAGEVTPQLATIELPDINETVKPDFAQRDILHMNFQEFSLEDVLWDRRMGSQAITEAISHGNGLPLVHSKEAMKKAHPEYYALSGGERDTEHRGHGTPCLSSNGLVDETVRYLRFRFDTFGENSLSIWPGDGLKSCSCDACSGKSTSELVWGFVDKVAREVYKTHPDKRIWCGAYTSYQQAPESISQFSPNVYVSLTNCGRARMMDEKHWAGYEANLRQWHSKLAPGRIARVENNRYHINSRGEGPNALLYPVIHPRAVDRDIKLLKEVAALGETGEQSMDPGVWAYMDLDHITMYVRSQLLWNASLDVDTILDDYCEKFYGPAAKQMKAFINFAEANMNYAESARGRTRGEPANVSLATALKLRDLLDQAMAAAGDGTVYAERIQALSSTLQLRQAVVDTFDKRMAQIAEARAKNPVAMGVAGNDLAAAKSFKLLDNRTGEAPSVETSFKVGWEGNSLILNIRCDEPDVKNISSAADVHSGDYVILLIETPEHSYYRILVTPEGKLLEGSPGTAWRSLSEVKTQKDDGSWSVNLKLPVVDAAEAMADPNHRMSGSKPTAQDPWFFNIGRQRIGAGGKVELQAFSPTKGSWDQVGTFARMEIQ